MVSSIDGWSQGQFVLGIYNDKITQFAKWGADDKKSKNASRGIFQFIHENDKTLPVPVSTIMVPVRGKSRHKHLERIKAWPMLFLSDWLKTAFQHPYDGFYLLGGRKADQLDKVKTMLSLFWERHQVVDPIAPEHPEVTIPFYVHGDEGRGLVKRPVLVLGAQPVMGWGSEECVASKKKLGTSFDQSFTEQS